jgi:hypothetical protein
MKNLTSLATMLIAALVIGFAFIPQAAHAVDNAADFINAINQANTAGSGTITLTGNITLTEVDNDTNGPNGTPVITGNITINGGGFTINRAEAAPNFRIFYVTEDGSLNLNDVTIAEWGNRDAIFNDGGELAVNNTVFSNNTSWGTPIGNQEGMLLVANSTFSGNYGFYSGGIHNNEGIATIIDSIFTNNIAYVGAGIFNVYGEVTVINSVFSNNMVSTNGGGIWSQGVLTVIGSTFSGNVAWLSSGGGIQSHGTMTVTNSVSSGNSSYLASAIYSASFNAAADITNSCIQNNITEWWENPDVYDGYDNLTAEDNWWGAPDGPNTPGADTINVEVTSWLTAPPEFCLPLADDGDSPPTAQQPAPPMCNMINSAEIDAYDLPDGFYCRVLMRDGAWQTHAGTVPQELIDHGVIVAVDVFHLSGRQETNDFGGHVPVCLQGEGRLIFLDATTSPRALIELETFNEGAYTCGWIPNAGTLVLIRGN